MNGEVSYENRGERRLLRFALWDAWGMKCYWCDVPKAYLEVQIDHIVPQGLPQNQLQKALLDYGLSDGFVIQKPENLAPICTPCNGPGRKGSHAYPRAAIIVEHLRRAADLQGKVVRTVQDFREGSELPQALLSLASADTDVPDVRDLFTAHFPAVARTSASIDPTLLDLPTYRKLYIDCGYPVGINLDSQFTRELWLLEDFLGCDLESALEEPLQGLMRELTSEMEGSLQSHSEFEPVTCGPPGPDAFDVRLVGIQIPHGALDGEIEVEFVLAFDGGLTNSATRYSDNGSERLDLQGSAELSGTAVVHGQVTGDEGLVLSEDVHLGSDFKIETWLE